MGTLKVLEREFTKRAILNDNPFLDKQLTQTRFKNKIHKSPLKESKMACRKQINFCVF